MRAKKIFEDEEFRFMKGPSKEKILQNLKRKSLKQKFDIGIENNIFWLIEFCIKNGLNFYKNYYLTKYKTGDTFIYFCSKRNTDEMIDISKEMYEFLNKYIK